MVPRTHLFHRTTRSAICGKKGAIIGLYQQPPEGVVVLCVDEMGPIGCRPYPTKRPASQRPTYSPSYEGKGSTWVFGALAPATGEALTFTSPRRRASDFLAFLDRVLDRWSSQEIVLILDNLSVHRALDVRLWALAHPRLRFLFLPTYSPWLNLIEPWWKTLRSLALRGSFFSHLHQLYSAISAATSFWNAHKHPFRWLKPP